MDLFVLDKEICNFFKTLDGYKLFILNLGIYVGTYLFYGTFKTSNKKSGRRK